MGIFWEVLLIEIGLFCESLLWVSFDWNRPLFHICQRRRSGVFACCSRISKAPLRRCCAVSFVGLFYGSLVIEIDLFWGSLLIEIGLLDTFHVCQCRRKWCLCMLPPASVWQHCVGAVRFFFKVSFDWNGFFLWVSLYVLHICQREVWSRMQRTTRQQCVGLK